MHSLPSALVALSVCAALSLQPAPAKQDAKPEGRIHTVAIVLYPGVELLDFAGPGEVFAGAHDHDGTGFRVVTVAESKGPFTSMGFLTITPQYTLADCPKVDIVVVPGGDVPDTSVSLRKWILARAQDTELMMSVCNGALVYARAGLLNGLEVTTHKSALQGVALVDPTIRVLTNRRFVDSGRVMTAAGISAGIDGALHVVERFGGQEMAWATARYMEYDWRPDELAKLHAQPGTAIEGAEALRLVASLRTTGVDSALQAFEKLEKKPKEPQLNAWGYQLMRSERVDESVDLFRLTTRLFPQSANAQDSLSEALESKGDVEGAKQAAKDCIALLDKNAEKLEPERRHVLHNASASRIARLTGTPVGKMPYMCPPCDRECDQLGYLEDGKCPNCAMPLVERPK